MTKASSLLVNNPPAILFGLERFPFLSLWINVMAPLLPMCRAPDPIMRTGSHSFQMPAPEGGSDHLPKIHGNSCACERRDTQNGFIPQEATALKPSLNLGTGRREEEEILLMLLYNSLLKPFQSRGATGTSPHRGNCVQRG